MSNFLSRRKVLTAGLATAGGAVGLAAAARLADRYGLIPPDWGGVWGLGETLTHACQRAIVSQHSMAREFNRSDMSKVAPVSGRRKGLILLDQVAGSSAPQHRREAALRGAQGSTNIAEELIDMVTRSLPEGSDSHSASIDAAEAGR